MTVNRSFARLRRLFIAGLLVLIPAVLTIAVLLWLFRTLDGVLGPSMTALTGWRLPGLGVLVTLILILALGMLSTNLLGRRLIGIGEKALSRVPVARSIYGATKGFLSSLADRPGDAFKRVVLIEYPRRDLWTLAFVTGSLRDQLPAVVPNSLTLFVPSTPNPTTGYLIVVAPGEVVDLELSIEEGLRLVMSGGILRPEAWKERPRDDDDEENRLT